MLGVVIVHVVASVLVTSAALERRDAAVVDEVVVPISGEDAVAFVVAGGAGVAFDLASVAEMDAVVVVAALHVAAVVVVDLS